MKPLIVRVTEKLDIMEMKLSDLSRELGIPYQRMAKWAQRSSSPKGDDAIKLEKWLNENPVKQLNGKTPNDIESLVIVLASRMSEVLSASSGRSAIVELERINKDAEELKKIRESGAFSQES